MHLARPHLTRPRNRIYLCAGLLRGAHAERTCEAHTDAPHPETGALYKRTRSQSLSRREMNACTAVPDGVLPEVPPAMRYASSTSIEHCRACAQFPIGCVMYVECTAARFTYGREIIRDGERERGERWHSAVRLWLVCDSRPRCVLSGLCAPASARCSVPLRGLVVKRSRGESTTGTITDALFCDNGHDSVLHVRCP